MDSDPSVTFCQPKVLGRATSLENTRYLCANRKLLDPNPLLFFRKLLCLAQPIIAVRRSCPVVTTRLSVASRILGHFTGVNWLSGSLNELRGTW